MRAPAESLRRSELARLIRSTMLSATELASRISVVLGRRVPPETVRLWRQGRHLPRPIVARALADALSELGRERTAAEVRSLFLDPPSPVGAALDAAFARVGRSADQRR